MAISLKYELTGVGWSRCTLTWPAGSRVLTASYLDDALGDFLRAVVEVLTGANESRASFAEEPGEYRWIFSKMRDEIIGLKIFEFEDLWSGKADEAGVLIVDIKCNRHELRNAALDMANQVARDYSADDYKQKWLQHEFPLSALDSLRQIRDA